MHISFGDTSRKASLEDTVELQGQTQEVVECEETGVLMLNIDAHELKTGDLAFIKKLGLTISDPDTERPVALGVNYKDNDSFGSHVASFLGGLAVASLGDDDDDDSSFFSPSFGGGFGGGFGGFSGGGFSGGGASRGF